MEKYDSKEWLEKEYETKSTYVIGRECGISYATICRRLKKFGIKIKSKNRKTVPRHVKYPKLQNDEWLKDQYYDKKRTITEIAQMVGSTPGNVASYMETRRFERRTTQETIKIKYPQGKYSREKKQSWNGGKYTSGGYIYILQLDHPKATKTGHVMEHRLIMEEYIGRYLEDDEVAHHINGKRDDNRIANLLLMNHGEHSRYHRSKSLLRKENIILKAGLCMIKLHFFKMKQNNN